MSITFGDVKWTSDKIGAHAVVNGLLLRAFNDGGWSTVPSPDAPAGAKLATFGNIKAPGDIETAKRHAYNHAVARRADEGRR